MRRKTVPKVVTWLSDEVYNPQSLSQSFKHYTKFKFGNIVAEIGDFVLISNADAAEPDTEAGCDAARIVSLYEDSTNTQDPFRAKVQWYSRPTDLPKWCLNNMDLNHFLDKEVIEDHRPFNTDISIETIFKKCTISFKLTKDVDRYIQEALHYICRYRLIALSRRKVNIEPILEEERNAMALLATPVKRNPLQKTITPNSLVKRMSRVSLTEEKNWSVTKNDGTKLLLKRAILADKNEKEPKTPKSSAKETPKRYQKVTENNIEEILSMELKENSDEDLPTLIIRQHVMTTPRRKQLTSNKDNFQKSPSVQHMPTTPKRKQSIAKTDEYTPKKVLVFDEDSICSQSARSRRITRKSFNYVENDMSPIKKTPVKKPRNSESDEDFKPALKMSRTPRTPRTPKTCTPSKSVSRRIITSQLTPSLKSRTHSIERDDFLGKENKSLPGREGQLDEILSFVRNKLLDRTSGCMYISGVPGTGKTATVCTALQMLKEEPDLPDFHLVEVNGMKITEPRQAYVQIYRQLTGKTVVWEQACSLLEKRFTNPGTKRTPTVLLVDELDALCTRRQDVLYSIMEWAAHNIAQLTVLAVANTMDLPERALAARVASRLGLTRLTFPPYTHTQLQKIVVTRLHGANVTPDAVQLIARKVAAVSGDARRALALCVRALELAGPGGAGLKEVERALGDTNASAAVRAIRGCSPAEKLMLRAVASEVERTGSDETTLSRALLTAAALVALEGRPYKSAPSIREPTPLQAQAICSRLAALRLLLLEPKPLEPKLLLNVSTDDVHYATKQINV